MSYRTDTTDLSRADWRWALKETLSYAWSGTLYRSTEDYWNIWHNRTDYITKYYGVSPADGASSND